MAKKKTGWDQVGGGRFAWEVIFEKIGDANVTARINLPNINGCMLWSGHTNDNGYGTYNHNLAHRIIWEALNGPIPEGLQVLHTCDVRQCVNPDHLYTGTFLDNAADRRKRGKGPYWYGPHGEAHLNINRVGEDVWECT